MAAPLSLDKSRLAEDSRTATLTVPERFPGDAASDLEPALRDLRLKLESATSMGDAFLNQVADRARQLIQADSTMVALRRGESVVCVARSGPLGPAIGTPMDSGSGISGECLRRGSSRKCLDSETDSEVDAEACRRLGIRSVVVVPILDGIEVVGLVEAFSSMAQAFEDSHVTTLEKLASLIAESRSRSHQEVGSPAANDSRPSLKPDLPLPALPQLATSVGSSVERRPGWQEAFRLRPYQIAMVIGFLLLDLATVYWWQR